MSDFDHDELALINLYRAQTERLQVINRKLLVDEWPKGSGNLIPYIESIEESLHREEIEKKELEGA